jgi:hypothetical protein
MRAFRKDCGDNLEKFKGRADFQKIKLATELAQKFLSEHGQCRCILRNLIQDVAKQNYKRY